MSHPDHCHLIDYDRLREYNAHRPQKADEIFSTFRSLLKPGRKCLQNDRKPPVKPSSLCQGFARLNSNKPPAPPQSTRQLWEDRLRHNVSLYTSQIHSGTDGPDQVTRALPMNLKLLIAELDRLLSTNNKLLDRNKTERSRIEEILTNLWPCGGERPLAPQLSASVIGQLGLIAVMESFGEVGSTIVCDNALYLLVAGVVTSLPAGPHELLMSSPRRRRLAVGDWFGTLTASNSGDMYVTTSADCRVMRIGGNDYSRVLSRLELQEINNKVQILRACAGYMEWSSQEQALLAPFIEMRQFPRGTVLLRQGCVPDRCVIVRRGSCELFKAFAGGKKRGPKRRDAVVIDTLTAGLSAGEFSMTHQELLPFSLVCSTLCEVGVILATSLPLMDETVRSGLEQFEPPRLVTRDDVRKLLVEQRKNADWMEMKRNVIVNWTRDYGIKFGRGKWNFKQTPL